METTLKTTHKRSFNLNRWKKPIAVGMIVFLALMWGFIIYISSHPYSDWRNSYRPPILMLLEGKNPYDYPAANNPAWTYLLLSPLALLPPALGNTAIGLICSVSFAFTGYRMGVKPLPLALLLFSPQIMFLSRNGGIDWLVVLGYIMPPQIGLFFVLIKPQIGIAVALFWMAEAWRKGGIKQVVVTFAPVSLAYLVSFLLFGLHAILPQQANALIEMKPNWDATMFPFSIPIGLLLITAAIRSRDLHKAILASPFLAPYVAFYSWPAAVLGLSESPLYMVVVLLGMWIVSSLTWQF